MEEGKEREGTRKRDRHRNIAEVETEADKDR